VYLVQFHSTVLQKFHAGLLPEKLVTKRIEVDSLQQKSNQIYRATLIRKTKAAKALTARQEF
jgi:hypothetical protein